MEKQIKCMRCRFARPDRNASEDGWTAYECGNRKSEYYKALVNVSEKGDMLSRITWEGCPCGERLKGGRK
jgi:hypothetical protein